MLFVETTVFTKDIKAFLPDEEYRQLQLALMLRSDSGELIQHSGGLRKIRWNLPGGGKRGGLRIIYYWDQPDTIYLLLAYQKSAQEDLTSGQLKMLRRFVKEWIQ
ncbi:MAG: type II toxin-antitoxin system RelE/ParE family toxin [Candidatus Hydrogenedentes bacterium]|nr:type II toxin-antitoxin system RelE/ParE family toxin [Candidatus Hydrogenedentota bacterium]